MQTMREFCVVRAIFIIINEKNRAVMNVMCSETLPPAAHTKKNKKKQILSTLTSARSSNTRCVVKVIHIHARAHARIAHFHSKRRKKRAKRT